MSAQDQSTPDQPTVDQQRGKFGSGGWDAAEEDRDPMTEVIGQEDVPKPDPDKDQG